MKPLIQTPELQALLVRVILAALAVGAFVTLGLALSETSVFDWALTVATLTATSLISGVFGSIQLPEAKSGKSGAVLAILASHPFLRVLARDRAAQIGAALLFGVTAATMKTALAASMTGVNPAVASIASLMVVLMGAYFLTERFIPRTPDWLDSLLDVLVPSADRAPSVVALRNAAAKTLIAVALNSAATFLGPVIFSNGWAVTFVAVLALFLLVGWDTLLQLSRLLSDASRAQVDREDAS